MMANLLEIAFNAADTIVVGKFSGQEALAAVGATGPIVNFMLSLFNGLAIGSNIVIARQLGSGKKDRISASVHTSYFLALAGGILLTIIGLLGSILFLDFMTHHTRQSAIGLPFIEHKKYQGQEFDVSVYTLSEIIASVYENMEHSGKKEGILFLDEINCVSETLAPSMEEVLDLYRNDFDTLNQYGISVKEWFLKNGAEADDLELLLHAYSCKICDIFLLLCNIQRK